MKRCNVVALHWVVNCHLKGAGGGEVQCPSRVSRVSRAVATRRCRFSLQRELALLGTSALARAWDALQLRRVRRVRVEWSVVERSGWQAQAFHPTSSLLLSSHWPLTTRTSHHVAESEKAMATDISCASVIRYGRPRSDGGHPLIAKRSMPKSYTDGYS